MNLLTMILHVSRYPLSCETLNECFDLRFDLSYDSEVLCNVTTEALVLFTTWKE